MSAAASVFSLFTGYIFVTRKRVGLTRYMTSVNAMTLGYIIVTRKGVCYYRLDIDTLLVGYKNVTRMDIDYYHVCNKNLLCLKVTKM